MRSEIIEYIGRNVSDGKLLTEKIYYHWDGNELSLPDHIKGFLYSISKGT